MILEVILEKVHLYAQNVLLGNTNQIQENLVVLIVQLVNIQHLKERQVVQNVMLVILVLLDQQQKVLVLYVQQGLVHQQGLHAESVKLEDINQKQVKQVVLNVRKDNIQQKKDQRVVKNVLLDILVQKDQRQKVIAPNVLLDSIQQKEQHVRIVQQENIHHQKDRQHVQHVMLDIIQKKEQLDVQSVQLDIINQMQERVHVQNAILFVKPVITSMEIA